MKLFEVRGEVPEEGFATPFGQADIKRRGTDVTIVATSLMVRRALEAAERAAAEGIEVEVIDLRTLVPLDKAAILSSLRRTGRLVVADECHRSCGVAAEIAALVAEEGFESLRAPVRRVATLDLPVPFSPPLERYIEPSVDRIVDAVRAVLA